MGLAAISAAQKEQDLAKGIGLENKGEDFPFAAGDGSKPTTTKKKMLPSFFVKKKKTSIMFIKYQNEEVTEAKMILPGGS